MKKLKLNLEDLKVESFSTEDIDKRQGTVVGNLTGTNAACESCAGFETCDACTGFSCPNTCYEDTCEGYSCYYTNCGTPSECVATCGETCYDNTCKKTCGFDCL
ncbi:MAG: pinensin family lanthipeptide [Ignavibacteria bacterium]|jgi:hypothetical protein